MYRKDNKDEFYTRKSKEEGYPARSIYKLKEIDEKHRLIKKGDFVLDLGSSPGSWVLYISDKVGDRGRVFAIDIEPANMPARANVDFVQKDIFELTETDLLKIKGRCNIVSADLAPKTTGVISNDVGKSLELSEKAFEIAKYVLKRGGHFISKIFEGEGVEDFIKVVEKDFRVLKRARPMAVIKHSKEFYIVAKGFTPK